MATSISNSYNNLTDEQKEEIGRVALNSIYAFAAISLYTQDDETGTAQKAGTLIMEQIAENLSKSNYSKVNTKSQSESQTYSIVKSSQLPVKAYPQKPLKIFMCHAKEDMQIVREFKASLAKYKYEIWLDDTDLLPGQEWEMEIRQAVQSSDIFLLCLSSSWVGRDGYVQKELRIAMAEAEKKTVGGILLFQQDLIIVQCHRH